MKKIFVSIIFMLLISMFIYNCVYAGVPIPTGVVNGMKQANKRNGNVRYTNSQSY